MGGKATGKQTQAQRPGYSIEKAHKALSNTDKYFKTNEENIGVF